MQQQRPATVEELKARLAALTPLLARHRAAMDRDRRTPRELHEALAGAGLFRLWLPRSLGGHELSPLDFMDVVEAAAALDGTVGWLVGNGGGMSRLGGYLPGREAAAIFARPDAFVAASTGAIGTARRDGSGYRLTGRWPFASGAHHATAFLALARVEETGTQAATAQNLIMACVSREDVELVDTWYVSGLRGTGSVDYLVREAFVPLAMTHAFPVFDPAEPGIVYRLPPVSAFAWTVATTPLGIARGALAAFADLARSRTRLGTSAPLAERETIQSMLGRCEMSCEAARALLRAAMTELMAATDAAEAVRLARARAALRSAATFAAETTTAVTGSLVAAAGAAAIFESCPLERCHRDAIAAAQHVAMSPANYIVSGRLALGLDPGTSRF